MRTIHLARCALCSDTRLLGLLLVGFLASCTSQKIPSDVCENYTVTYSRKDPRVEVYRYAHSNKKLTGKVERSATGLYDSTLQFRLVGQFEKGLLHGVDSVFRNDTLISEERYVQGVKSGDQVEIADASRTVSPFVDGVIHGFQRTYTQDQIQKAAYFNHGVKDSVEYFYNTSGKIATTFRYDLIKSEHWEWRLNLDRQHLVAYSASASPDTLQLELLKRADYRGTIVFNSYDPKGIGAAWPADVIHPSVAANDLYDPDASHYGYFYIIDENDCIACDTIDHDGIWVAYYNGFALAYYELRPF